MTIADRIRARLDAWEADHSGDADVCGGACAVGQGIAAIRVVMDLHQPYRIYRDCGHWHNEHDPGVVEIDDVGYVCADGLMYTICWVCCTADGDQTERCANRHQHGPQCPTVAAIATAMGVKEAT